MTSFVLFALVGVPAFTALLVSVASGRPPRPTRGEVEGRSRHPTSLPGSPSVALTAAGEAWAQRAADLAVLRDIEQREGWA